jgi:hypothetical protein
VLRVGDAASPRGFAASRWVDRIVALARGRGLPTIAGRPLAAWQARLEALGFAVASEPMHAGTPFANVLLVAIVERAPAPSQTAA